MTDSPDQPVEQQVESADQVSDSVEPDFQHPAESGAPPPAARPSADLAAIERDLDGVGTALRRLDDGSYWTDEVTGDPISDEVLAADPVARRAG